MMLLPYPKHIDYRSTHLTLPRDWYIVMQSPEMLFEAQWIQSVLLNHGYKSQVVTNLYLETIALHLNLHETLNSEQYRLKISPDGITLDAGDTAGIFYGLCTLRQLLMQHENGELQCMTIEDAPDFEVRGVMLDISRDKVPTLETLKMLVDEFAAMKLNQLQLYTEHTFAYQQHSQVWRQASPLTAQDILTLDAYCRQRHIELVPNQNSLGHMERWLKFPEYNDMAEKPEGFTAPWGEERTASTLDPQDPRSFEFITGLYDELLPNFTSKQINVGADEPWELGQGKSKEAVDERGGRVYLDWLQKLHANLKERGYRMMFWADIIVKYPDLIPELPDDVIALEWGYESNHPFDEHCQLYADAGIEFYVVPGTSSWNSLVGRTKNTIENMRYAARAGIDYGATGYLIADWGDNGHWQPLPVSYLGFMYGAAISWCYQTNSEIDIAEGLSRFIFKDDTLWMGQIAYDLGNIYRMIGAENVNGQVLAYALQRPLDELDALIARLDEWAGDKKADVSWETLTHTVGHLEVLIARLRKVRMQRPDADLIINEFETAANLLKFGAQWLLLAQDEELDRDQLRNNLEALLMQQRDNWLARNRRGGLEDSMARFEHLLS